MAEEEKQAKNNIKKSVIRNQRPIKMNYCWKKQKEVKKVANYQKKKKNKWKNMSKIKMKKIYKQFKWL